MIPYGKQSIDQDDIDAVVEVLKSDFLTCGPKVEEFENAFAEMCGAKYAVSCANGTAALHLAMLAAGIDRGDLVATTPITFLASANAAAYVGATPWFSDIEPVAATLDAELLEENWKEGTTAVVAVDYAGHPANHQRLAEIAHSRGAVLIEDACHAVGGFWKKGDERYPVGGLPWVDMAAFSFHPVKTMTTGEGGMLVTNNPDFARTARELRTHGMVRDHERFQSFGKPGSLEEVGSWAYEMHDLGLNYRLTDIQCALGLSQLKRLQGFVRRRAEIVAKYVEALEGTRHISCPRVAEWIDDDCEIGWHLFPVRIDFGKLGMSRSMFSGVLRENGVGTQVHYIPVSEQPYYRNSTEGTEFIEAKRFYAETLSLPLFSSMSNSDVEKVVEIVREAVRN